MKHVAPVRRELGVRTLFNILGPLTNPAGADNQVMGVFHPDLVGIQARVLRQLGSRHVMVVHGEDGLDEITLTGPTKVAELKNGSVQEYTLNPRDFGLLCCQMDELKAENAVDSAARVRAVLAGEPGPCRDIVLLNAGAAIYVAGLADNLADSIERARHAIDSGAAQRTLAALAERSSALAQ